MATSSRPVGSEADAGGTDAGGRLPRTDRSPDVRALLRSELLKQRSTRTTLGLFAAMLGLVLLAVLLHGLLPAQSLRSPNNQLTILGRGEFLGALFAGLVGALSVTAGSATGRSGRPSSSPHGVAASSGRRSGRACSPGRCSDSRRSGCRGHRRGGVSSARDRPRLDGGDYVLLVAGAMGAAALWAAIGVGVGAVVRHQVPTVVGSAHGCCSSRACWPAISSDSGTSQVPSRLRRSGGQRAGAGEVARSRAQPGAARCVCGRRGARRRLGNLPQRRGVNDVFVLTPRELGPERRGGPAERRAARGSAVERPDHGDRPEPLHVDAHRVTGRHIKETASIPLGFALYRRVQGGNEPIRDDAQVELRNGDHFFARAPSNAS